jgi:2-iminobutanoate/2-iminopropanoate deaminase
MTTRQKISTKHAPAAIGPYSQAIVAGGFVHCSGQVALHPETGEIVGKDVTEQAERAFENMRGVLAAAGTDFSRVVKCTVFLVKMSDFAAANAVYARYFTGDAPPARSTVAVHELPRGALFEFDCVALVG